MIADLISQEMKALHNAYVPLRPRTTPFPPQSVLAWLFVLSLQKEMRISGDMLEVGVENGGTAFMLSAAARADEVINLVDFQRTALFDESFARLDERSAAQILYHKAYSNSEDLAPLESQKFRFIHIDGGHAYQDVMNDLVRLLPTTADDGLVCLDDVFEIRWPGVTEAVFDFIPNSGFTPVLFVDRKLYLVRDASAERYREAIKQSKSAMAAFAEVREWVEPFFGGSCTIMKMAPQRGVAREAL